LGQPRTRGRSQDERFVARVYDADERAAIREAADPDLEVWAHWAAKEAGFKVVSKLLGAPPAFVHRAFKVIWTEVLSGSPVVGAIVRRGAVTYEDLKAHVTVTLHPGGVHAVGFGAPDALPDKAPLHPKVEPLDATARPWSGELEELRQRFTPRELDAVYSRHSAAVRLGARAELAGAMGVDERRLEIVCDPGPTSQRPPRVLLDGSPAPADVSLSHDGRWIAWVLWLDPETETT
jgi:phosphopantetheinyl transferase (holo-ACP synthase)